MDTIDDSNISVEVTSSKRLRIPFLNQIDEILVECSSSSVQRGLFSATMTPIGMIMMNDDSIDE